jgi:hypothetical protein
VVPASQIIPTSPRAFAITVLGATAGATLLLCGAIWEELTFERAAVQALEVFLGLAPFALVGAAVGGMLALMCGANLSRQYCWLFALASGMVSVPVVAYTASQLMTVFQLDKWLASKLGSFDYEPYAIFTPLVGGIAIAFITTRARTGLARRSRRAAWIAAPVGLACYGIVHLLYWYGMWKRNINVYSVPGYAFFWMHVTLGGFFALMSAGIAAAWCAERPLETRWEVLPLNEFNPQTVTTVDPALPTAR